MDHRVSGTARIRGPSSAEDVSEPREASTRTAARVSARLLRAPRNVGAELLRTSRGPIAGLPTRCRSRSEGSEVNGYDEIGKHGVFRVCWGTLQVRVLLPVTSIFALQARSGYRPDLPVPSPRREPGPGSDGAEARGSPGTNRGRVSLPLPGRP